MKILELIFFIVLVSSCQNKETNKAQKKSQEIITNEIIKIGEISNADSIEIQSLIRKVYEWNENNIKPYFNIGIEDENKEKYIAIDWNIYEKNAKALIETGFFSKIFIDSYKNTLEHIQNKLENGNYENDWYVGYLPPFGTGANEWCHCQDVPIDDYWKTIEIYHIVPKAQSVKVIWNWGKEIEWEWINDEKNGYPLDIVSDENCKVIPSPITFSSIYGGEDYDATLEQKAWSTYGFDDTQWQKPVLINDSIEKLVPEKDYPLKVMDEFLPVKILTSKTGRTIYDCGQNASGIIALKVKGNKGSRVIIRPDELINEEGNITQHSGGGPYEYNYTLRGEGIEEWQPKFTYYGFRFADVEIIESANSTKKTEIVELKMLHTRNASPTVGTFSCSDTLFNQIFELINWSIKSNMASVATDCPHREKLGWLEQTYLIGPSMHYNYEIHLLYNKIVNDMIDSQLENGLVPDIAPEYVPFSDGFRDSPEWGSASVMIPWQLYQWYGDMEVLKRAYPMMIRYVDYLQSKSKKNILYHGLGDWYDLGPKHPGEAQLTPKAVTATSIYYYDLIVVSKVAKLLNKDSDIKKYSDLAIEI